MLTIFFVIVSLNGKKMYDKKFDILQNRKYYRYIHA